MSDDSSSEMMELEDTALLADPHMEQNLRRLREEERALLEQQAVMETGTFDDISTLEHQDALRLNHLQQQEIQKQQQAAAQRLAFRQSNSQTPDSMISLSRQPRRRATCTVRVNNLHSAEAIETDV